MAENEKSSSKDAAIDRTKRDEGDARVFSIDMPNLEADRRYEERGGGGADDGGRKPSISTTACSAVMLVMVCFAISLAIVLLVSCVNKSICPVRRSLRKTVIASAIFLVIASTAAAYLAAKLLRSVRLYLKI